MTDEVSVPSGTSLAPPTGAELAAVLAAVEAVWPRSDGTPDDGAAAASWRFSGRWWARPVALRRQRPWVG